MQNATRQSFLSNTDSSGNLNRAGVLSDLGKINPQAAMELNNQFVAQDKAKADAQKAQSEAAQTALNNVLPRMDYMAGLPEADRASAYPGIRSQLESEGVDISRMPNQYDPNWFRSAYGQLSTAKPKLEQMSKMADIQKTQTDTQKAQAETGKIPSEIAKNKAEIGLMGPKLNSELYGSRSPNAELTSQYDKQVAPIRASQLAMQQMYDNYNHPSPQGDASLILNAFKIKFPTAPDVNSLEELSKSQSATDQWKQWAAHATAGGLDQGTRDNLMRDAASTFRANVDSLQGIKQRYLARAKQQNVNDPTLTAEPAIDKTYKDVMDLQKNIGPYVPPAERGGLMSSVTGFASKLLGSGGSQKPSIKPGSVEDGFVYLGGDPGNPKSWKRAK